MTSAEIRHCQRSAVVANRYVSAIPMKDSSSISVVNAFLHGYVSHFGVPATVTTDRGAQFESNLWTQLMQCIGAKRNRTTSYHPQCNGLIENFHRRLKDALRVQQNPTDWAITLPLVLLHIRNTVKEDLDCSSAEYVLLCRAFLFCLLVCFSLSYNSICSMYLSAFLCKVLQPCTILITTISNITVCML